MNVQFLLYLILRFVNPLPVVEMPLPEMPEIVMEEPETVMEEPAYVHLETGETIYMEEGQDGGDVDLSELDLY